MTAARPAPSGDSPGQTFRIVSYNLQSYGKSAMPTRRAQHELLRFQRADAICLQEIYAVDGGQDELTDLVSTIADQVGMDFLSVPAVHSDCHLAILWRPEYAALSCRAYNLHLWHGLGIVQLDVGGNAPLTVAVTHLGPWDPTKQFADANTLTGKLTLSEATILAADWNSFGANAGYDPEPDWSALPSEWIPRHVRWNDDPDAPPIADRRPAQLMQRSGFHDVAPALGAVWQPTGGHQGGWRRREDVFWTTRPAMLRSYQVIDTPEARRHSDHLPIRVDLDTGAL